jgi:hypothetical protein
VDSFPDFNARYEIAPGALKQHDCVRTAESCIDELLFVAELKLAEYRD